MITYVDTSTLIIDEPGSLAAAAIWDKSDVVASVVLTYVEARAVLAERHHRCGYVAISYV
jgi:hypothetical protein